MLFVPLSGILPLWFRRLLSTQKSFLLCQLISFVHTQAAAASFGSSDVRMQKGSIYFLSDFHLGAPNAAKSRQREKQIVQFLTGVAATGSEIFLMGDLFDFWFEYRHAAPKGYSRLLGTLALMTDAGMPIHVFTGNHDMWMRNYLVEECGVQLHHEPEEMVRFGKKLYLAHGDGLGPGDHGYKMLKKVFRNPFCQWLFGLLHPDWGIGLANFFSRRSRAQTGFSEQRFLGEDKEWLIVHSKAWLAAHPTDYFIYGHRHFPLLYPLNNGESLYANCGDWINYNTYLELQPNGTLHLHKWPEQS